MDAETEFKIRMTAAEYNSITRVLQAEAAGEAYDARDAKLRSNFLTKCVTAAQLRRRRRAKRRTNHAVQNSEA